jgi:5'-3' exonuclease
MIRNVLIDGRNLLYRAHAIHVDLRQKKCEPPFCSRSGYPTGVIYGTLLMLSNWLPDIESPTSAIFFLDGIPKRRRELDPGYKLKDGLGITLGHSEHVKLLDGYEASCDIDVISHILQLFGVDTVFNPDEEADDLIASYVKQHLNEINIIMSSDKDFYQIISDTVILYRPGTDGDRFYDAERAEDHMFRLYKVHISPKSIRMFKSLTGDASDTIVGIPRLRKKVAAPLCVQPDVDAVYATGLPGFSKSEKAKALELKDRIKLNFELTRLDQDLDVELFRKHTEPNIDMAMKILNDDFQIYGIDRQSFRFDSNKHIRISDAVAVETANPIPDNLFDNI